MYLMDITWSTVGSAALGTITGQANSPRNLQLALKTLW
jgi:hypothetical protein